MMFGKNISQLKPEGICFRTYFPVIRVRKTSLYDAVHWPIYGSLIEVISLLGANHLVNLVGPKSILWFILRNTKFHTFNHSYITCKKVSVCTFQSNLN